MGKILGGLDIVLVISLLRAFEIEKFKTFRTVDPITREIIDDATVVEECGRTKTAVTIGKIVGLGGVFYFEVQVRVTGINEDRSHPETVERVGRILRILDTDLVGTHGSGVTEVGVGAADRFGFILVAGGGVLEEITVASGL